MYQNSSSSRKFHIVGQGRSVISTEIKMSRDWEQQPHSIIIVRWKRGKSEIIIVLGLIWWHISARKGKRKVFYDIQNSCKISAISVHTSILYTFFEILSFWWFGMLFWSPLRAWKKNRLQNYRVSEQLPLSRRGNKWLVL